MCILLKLTTDSSSILLSHQRAVVTKLASSLLCIALFVVMSKIFPFHINAGERVNLYICLFIFFMYFYVFIYVFIFYLLVIYLAR